MPSFAEGSMFSGFRPADSFVGFSVDRSRTVDSPLSQPSTGEAQVVHKQYPNGYLTESSVPDDIFINPPIKPERTKTEKMIHKATNPVRKVVFKARQWLNQSAI